MKLLIMCEGPNELKIINILLENQKLKFSSDDLLGLVPYHARQIKSSAAVKAALNLYPDEVHVLRIGDGQNEKLEIPSAYLEIPSAYRDKITLVEKYCTKPELEMLLIISENLADEYEKVKSKQNRRPLQKRIFAVEKEDTIIVQPSTKNTLVRIVKSWLLLLKHIDNTMAHTRETNIT